MIKRVTDDAREDEMEENLGQVSLKHVINHSKGSKMTKIDLTAPYWLMIMDSVAMYSWPTVLTNHVHSRLQYLLK